MVTKKLKKEIVKEKVLENEIVTDKNTEKAVDITIAEIVNNEGQVVRVYSKEIHGDDFMKLAEEFAGKKGYSLK